MLYLSFAFCDIKTTETTQENRWSLSVLFASMNFGIREFCLQLLQIFFFVKNKNERKTNMNLNLINFRSLFCYQVVQIVCNEQIFVLPI